MVTDREKAEEALTELTMAKLRELLRGPLAEQVMSKVEASRCPLSFAFEHLGIDGAEVGCKLLCVRDFDGYLMHELDLTSDQMVFVEAFDSIPFDEDDPEEDMQRRGIEVAGMDELFEGRL